MTVRVPYGAQRQGAGNLGVQHARKPSRGWRRGSPGLYRPGPAFRGEAADKLATALDVTGVSSTTLFLELLNRLEVDDEGWPLDENGERLFCDGQEELPMTGT